MHDRTKLKMSCWHTLHVCQVNHLPLHHHVGMSENGVQTPNEIAINSRDNDQQNQTGCRGFLYFQTNPCCLSVSDLLDLLSPWDQTAGDRVRRWFVTGSPEGRESTAVFGESSPQVMVNAGETIWNGRTNLVCSRNCWCVDINLQDPSLYIYV